MMAEIIPFLSRPKQKRRGRKRTKPRNNIVNLMTHRERIAREIFVDRMQKMVSVLCSFPLIEWQVVPGEDEQQISLLIRCPDQEHARKLQAALAKNGVKVAETANGAGIFWNPV